MCAQRPTCARLAFGWLATVCKVQAATEAGRCFMIYNLTEIDWPLGGVL